MRYEDFYRQSIEQPEQFWDDMILHFLNVTVIFLPLFSPIIFILFTSILCILDYAPLARDLGREL